MKKSHYCAVSLILGILSVSAASAQDTPPESTPPAAPAQTAAANPAADLTAAAEKLAAATNYSWSQATSFGNRGGRTITGKKGSGGYLLLKIPGRDQEMQVLIRKDKAAMESADGWALADPDAEGRGRFIAMMVKNLREPVIEAKELASKVTELKIENGNISGTLDAEAAKHLMGMGMGGGFGRRGGGGGGGFTPPEITGAGGSVTFTVSNGELTGYDISLTGHMNFNGEDREINRTTKVEFSGVGSTTFDIPEAAAGALAN